MGSITPLNSGIATDITTPGPVSPKLSALHSSSISEYVISALKIGISSSFKSSFPVIGFSCFDPSGTVTRKKDCKSTNASINGLPSRKKKCRKTASFPLAPRSFSCEPIENTGIVLIPVSYTHLRAHETRHDLVCRLLLEKKKKSTNHQTFI